jgi:DNA-binding MarR family transcriptional regulator
MPHGMPSDSVVNAWVRLVRAQRKALLGIEAEIKAAGFPPLAWYDILLELKRAGGTVRPQEIEAKLLLAQHNVSRLIDRLAEAGLVERRPVPDDARGQTIAITAAGRDLQKRMWAVYGPAIHKHVGMPLGDDREADALWKLLGRLTENEG